MTIDPEQLADVAEAAARAAGVLLVRMQRSVVAREKRPKDLVTEADVTAQRLIAEMILARYPDHQFLGEESPEAEQLGTVEASGYRWIVDPLDGTTNYAHGFPSYAVSIAVEFRGQVLAGVVLDPVLDECFRASRGSESRLNGAPIQPSSCRRLEAAMVAVSLPASIQRASREVQRFVEVMTEAQAVRRLGSAALNMCYVAAGRLDAYWASSVKAWDVAAGALILEQAGGVLTSLTGGEFRLTEPHLLTAATRQLHGELHGVLGRIPG